MSNLEFVQTVAKMRDHQKAFFKDRSSRKDLEEAKRLEKVVDKAISDFAKNSGQKSLFNG